MKSFLLLCLYWSVNSTALLAGAWTGGGELLRDSLNPWFLENISRVTYCILSDQENFPVDEESLDDRIGFALNYWREQYESVQAYGDNIHGQRYMRLSTQQFIRRSCNEDVDLRFQFGILSKEQLLWLETMAASPSEYVAFSYRTNDVSLKDLKGTGFIYIAPESGPLRPNFSQALAKPWSSRRSQRLTAILIHELGHVFGVPHLGGSRSIMGTGFPQYLISPESEKDASFPSGIIWPGILHFQWKKAQTACQKTAEDPLLKFFGIPISEGCVLVNFLSQTQADVTWFAKNTGLQRAGIIQLQEQKSIRFEELSKIWLPAGQTLFPWTKDRFVSTPPKVILQRAGDFQSVDGSIKHKLILDLGPDQFRMTGIVNDQIFLNLFDNAIP